MRAAEKRPRFVADVWAIACLTIATACSSSCSGTGSDGTSGTRSPFSAPSTPGERAIGRVGNQASGIDAMPDWDASARRVRASVSPRLPDPLPTAEKACKQMLDAAVRFYADSEGERSRAFATIESIRAADERACVAETSAAAAACVAILLGDSAGEYPWLLDQCSRAFPRS